MYIWPVMLIFIWSFHMIISSIMIKRREDQNIIIAGISYDHFMDHVAWSRQMIMIIFSFIMFMFMFMIIMSFVVFRPSVSENNRVWDRFSEIRLKHALIWIFIAYSITYLTQIGYPGIKLRVVQTGAKLFLKWMSELGGSDIEKIWI